MKGVGPAVLDKPLEDDPRFEQLPAVSSDLYFDLSGVDSPMNVQHLQCASFSAMGNWL